MISDIFIDRPRLAFVVSIVITLAGLIAITADSRLRSFPTSCRRRSRSPRPIPAPMPRWSRRRWRSRSSSRSTASTTRSIISRPAAPTAATR